MDTYSKLINYQIFPLRAQCKGCKWVWTKSFKSRFFYRIMSKCQSNDSILGFCRSRNLKLDGIQPNGYYPKFSSWRLYQLRKTFWVWMVFMQQWNVRLLMILRWCEFLKDFCKLLRNPIHNHTLSCHIHLFNGRF